MDSGSDWEQILGLACEGQHILPEQLIFLLRTQGFDTLNKLADPGLNNHLVPRMEIVK
jgi:hypothetical protein